MPEDKVAAYLAGVRERSDRPLGPGVGALPISNEAVRHLMESAADVPHLLAAVGAALKYHRREETSWGPVCGGCWTKGGSHPVWPCMPMVDMVDALLSEETHGAV
jgi:hypothetical protein